MRYSTTKYKFSALYMCTGRHIDFQKCNYLPCGLSEENSALKPRCAPLTKSSQQRIFKQLEFESTVLPINGFFEDRGVKYVIMEPYNCKILLREIVQNYIYIATEQNLCNSINTVQYSKILSELIVFQLKKGNI